MTEMRPVWMYTADPVLASGKVCNRQLDIGGGCVGDLRVRLSDSFLIGVRPWLAVTKW